MQPIIDFILELDKLKAVTRKIRPLGLERYENSAEHSWQLALLAVSLEAYAAAPVDISRVVMMLLLHDIGEIETGDTLAFVEGGWEERKANELLGVTRIFGLLNDPELSQRFLELWKEFEAAQTPEAVFANAVDRAMPVLQNLHNGGQSWRENRISYERVVKRVQPPIQAGAPALWAYIQTRLDRAHSEGIFSEALV